VAKGTKASEVVRQLLALQGEALFDKIAELEPTAERKATVRWALPMLAEAIVTTIAEGEARSEAAERSRRASFVSKLAVSILNGQHCEPSIGELPGSFDAAKRAVHLAKAIADESELAVLADDEAHEAAEHAQTLPETWEAPIARESNGGAPS
jgi:hypothetical protein